MSGDVLGSAVSRLGTDRSDVAVRWPWSSPMTAMAQSERAYGDDRVKDSKAGQV